MAAVKIVTMIEGNIDKFESYNALCKNVGLEMLVDRSTNQYVVENGKLYRKYDKAYHGSVSEDMEFITSDARQVMLFENLLAIKCIL